VKKHPSKQPTKPEGFHLETEKRTEVWESHKDQGETPYEFHARPVPSKILEKPVVRTLKEGCLRLCSSNIYQYEDIKGATSTK